MEARIQLARVFSCGTSTQLRQPQPTAPTVALWPEPTTRRHVSGAASRGAIRDGVVL
ncbi:MAG: hypothetical protein ACI9QQ_001396 [Myxococcota bacterium]|jgi:hypothetical protein